MYKKIAIFALLSLAVTIFLVSELNFSDGLAPTAPKKEQIVAIIEQLPKSKYVKTGIVRLSDGDSLQFGNKQNRARLFAIDSPELAQKCKLNGKNWKCGEAAKNALRGKINGQKITCIGDENDRYGRLIATCYLPINNGQAYLNLNAWMVKNGWAIAYRYYSERYVSQEAYAKSNSLGIWQSQFLEPFKWRQNNNRN